MSPKNKAIAQMLLCASLWSTGGIFIKLIPWNPMAIAGWRSLIAAGVVVFYLRRGRVPVRFTRGSLSHGVWTCLTFLAFVAANKLTTAANAIVLQFTAPIFLMVFSALLLHEKLRRADVAAVTCTLGGISLFFLDQLQPGYLLGNCIAIAAGACMGAMYLCIGQSDAPARMGGMLLGHLFTAAVGVPFTFFTPAPLSVPAVGSLATLGVVQLGIPYILLILSSENCPPLACSLLGAMEPLLNPVWVFLFDGEAPGPFALVGGAAVVASVTAWCIWQNRHPAPAAGTGGARPAGKEQTT
jgi:drug/metabolite transporter (DMT)-like permease